MMKQCFFLLCCTACFGSELEFFQTDCYPRNKMKPEVVEEPRDSSVRAGGSYSHVWLKPEGNPKFQGNLGGLQAIYEYKPANSLYAGLQLSWRQGATSQASSRRFLLDVDTNERIGYTFAWDERAWMTTLFSGLGYRYLGQILKQPGLANLSFNYNEIYIPIGILANRSFNARWALGLNFVWMPQVYPSLTINPLKGAYWMLSRKLENFLVEIPLVFTPSKMRNFMIELKPFFEYWQDGKTDAVTSLGFTLDIPGNTYVFCGVELSIGGTF
jgi:hypothetical protein